ncbi:similar to Saccharomyces cerevisiae YMR110C HFD1 Putative fatty aldehyde dehydrogenase, located in the mitochondrial outer membrane and also in lipid particles [Maudiozyma saulgeensis]|uniref:Aldehyde dehydrogenase n=1 Tax=Maudiozyma saulgeensis TaxID=1789683 RepID=A0A1X7R0K2_9SACH|nr:similar to Saccharomyces cerevisiae YMR110C HFD1 Putative fatty aldehyde dehydrogenase, located in the mitochondrial outer membrane and also in lipid particles [Kazachstania saulgeensis]
MKELNYTPLDVIDTKLTVSSECFFERQKELSHATNIRKTDLQFRIKQLKTLYYAIKKNEKNLIDAMYEDYHRAPQESMQLELIPLYNDILNMIKSLSKWMKPRRIYDMSPTYMLGKTYVEKIAMGSVLVISPCNFPVLLALTPVANAIAAGNTVILKPSEMTPATAIQMQQLIENACFPHGLLQVVQGAIPETSQLIKSKTLNMIFYTGSPKVGSIVAQEAAKNLVPCVLELGGKSPAFMTKKFDINNNSKLKTAIKRIFFGAFSNGGQICVTPDYLLVHESIYDKVVEQAKIVLNEMYPTFNGDLDYTHTIGPRGYNAIIKKLEESSGTKYIPQSANGFVSNEEKGQYCIPPTLILDCSWDDSLMEEENFGPVLPIYKYSVLDETLDMIIKKNDQPLVQYIFSDSEHERQHILTRLRSGDCIIGDTIIHVAIQDAPFGGIGNSGYGNYGGVYGFDAFTNERTVFKQPYWMDKMLFMRYPPYNETKLKLVEAATEQQPWFDEDGNNRWYRNKFFYLFTVVGVAVAAACNQYA